MPDHFHWLVKLDQETTLQKLARNLKGRSARRISKSRLATTRIWQPGYHDHAVRVEEDLENLSNYLILNPVRAGLVRNVDDYPFWDSVWHQRKVCRG
jgi:REP element-mobilizing transposase RayT